jgi:hypothetical protein
VGSLWNFSGCSLYQVDEALGGCRTRRHRRRQDRNLRHDRRRHRRHRGCDTHRPYRGHCGRRDCCQSRGGCGEGGRGWRVCGFCRTRHCYARRLWAESPTERRRGERQRQQQRRRRRHTNTRRARRCGDEDGRESAAPRHPLAPDGHDQGAFYRASHRRVLPRESPPPPPQFPRLRRPEELRPLPPTPLIGIRW